MRWLAIAVMLGACAEVPEAPRVLLDPPSIDLDKVYPGQTATRTVAVVDLSPPGQAIDLVALQVEGDGADWLEVRPPSPLPARLVDRLELELLLDVPLDAPTGAYATTLSAELDDGEASTLVTARVYFDARDCDEDGDGDAVLACGGGDCDDDDPARSSLAVELCNDVDDDCNGIVDDVDDADGDGFTLCTDCDDTDPEIRPGAPERCNGLDDDCDGSLGPDELDGDGDGFSECEGDCNELDPLIYPGALERCNGLDDDCDGLTDDAEDQDDDAFTVCEDCDDTDRTTYPGAPEQCDGIDNDCDGVLPDAEADLDGDGVALCELDCDDDDPDVFPGNREQCNAIDDDCDEIIDEAPACPCTRVEQFGDIYLVCDSPRAWTAAQSQCSAWGYHLLTVDDRAEDRFATAEVRDSNPDTRWWMGFNDRAVEGTWEWEDGSGVTYTNWQSEEPNDLGGEDCGQLNFFEDGTWNDQACSLTYPFVCELD